MLSAPDPLRTPASADPIDGAIPGGPPPLPPAEGVALDGRIRAPPSGVRGTADLSFLVEADVDLRKNDSNKFFVEVNGFFIFTMKLMKMIIDTSLNKSIQ